MLTDLQANVGLESCVPHLYAPWDPERFIAEPGEKHLAVWPAPDLETVAPLTTMAHELTQNYVIAYWEGAGEEDQRQVADQEAARDLLALHNLIRARLYELANQVIGDTFKVWYAGALVNDATSHTRWLTVFVEAHRAMEFS